VGTMTVGGLGGVGEILRRSLSDFVPGRSGSFLAIDIGSSCVKLVETDGSAGSIRLVTAGIAPLPPTAVQNNVIQDAEQVAATIRGLVKQTGARATSVITAVPGPAVMIKKIVLPGGDEANLDHQVMLEAGSAIPENLENVTLDYQVLGYTDREEIEVLLVAVKKDILNSYTSAIRMAGLSPVIVDVDYFALENMFELNYDVDESQVIGLVNVGARYCSINILRGGRSSFTGDIPVGGAEFTDVLTRNLGVTADEAELLKTGGTVRAINRDQTEAALTPAVTLLVEEIHRALSFYWRSDAEEPLAAVYLSGGTARTTGLAKTLGDRLETQVELADPLARVTLGRGSAAELIREHAPSLAVAVGLAARRPGDKT
jgi:type IV pilus assembly protein PilM